MRLGMLSQWYDPEPGPASLPGVLAREFVGRGHQVSVLTGFPNYPDGVVAPGYRIRARQAERHEGVRLTRVALYPDHSSSALGRMANYASFAASATVLGRGALRGVDAVWVYNSPITVSLPLLTHTRMGRTPFFLHVQDLWPESLIGSGMFPGGRIGRVASRVIEGIVGLTERRAGVVGVISPSVRELILERNPRLDPARIVYVPNPTNEQLFRPVADLRAEASIDPAADGPVEVMYAGAIGEVQGLDTLIDAARLLADRDDIRISLVGDGISLQRLQQRVAELGLTNVHFLGRVPQESVPGLLARAAIQLVSLAPARFLELTTPSKISALLASGVPIIGHLQGDGARVIEASGAGSVVQPGDAPALAEAIRTMVDGGPGRWAELGERGRAHYEATMSVAITGTRILDALGGTPGETGNGGPGR